MRVSGSAYAVAEVGEILAWLHATLIVHFGDGIDVTEPSVKVKLLNGYGACWIGSSIKGLAKYQALDASADCWHNILGDTVCVRGYPTPRRPRLQTGMEVSLDAMLALAKARKVIIFKGVACIKGFCSIIIPTGRQDDVIYWHLTTNLDGSYMSYTNEKPVAREGFRGLSYHDLETCRHVLGWSNCVQNLAGMFYSSWSRITHNFGTFY